ncbi:MAG: HD domain-containing protein [Eubacteriales bacterium]|nr:HD domain-containing protein [Eubacteriales bacterium]
MKYVYEYAPGLSREELLSRSLDTMVKLIDLTQALAAAHDLNSIMEIVRHGARDLTGADGATFVLREGDFCFYADEDAILPLWKGSRFPMNDCVSGWAMEHHQTVVIPDIYKDDRVPHAAYEPTFVRSMAVVPIRSDNPLGAIGCYWSAQHEASSFQVRLLQILANTAAIAMENIHYELELASKAGLLEKAFESTLLSISRMIDLRDAYTSGHQRRVGLIARHIGESLGYLPDHCQALYWAGIVHDVGKIAIPAEILSKPARLTDIEFKLIQGHPETGYEILRDVDMPFPIADIVRQHHERLDGSGYPQGLSGTRILREAQILAVADVFEAMVSHRPYRPALGYEAALTELEAHRGTWYDAHSVDALVRLVRDGFTLPD